MCDIIFHINKKFTIQFLNLKSQIFHINIYNLHYIWIPRI